MKKKKVVDRSKSKSKSASHSEEVPKNKLVQNIENMIENVESFHKTRFEMLKLILEGGDSNMIESVPELMKIFCDERREELKRLELQLREAKNFNVNKCHKYIPCLYSY